MPGSQSKFYFYVNVTFENTRAYGCVNNNFDITRNLRCCGFVMEMMVAPTSTISLSFPWLPRHGPVTFLRVRKCAGLSIQRDCSGLTYPHHNNFGLCLPSRPKFGKKKKKSVELALHVPLQIDWAHQPTTYPFHNCDQTIQPPKLNGQKT